MIDESTYDELDRFLTGTFNADEVKKFAQKLESDAELNSELFWLKSTAIALQLNGRQVMKPHIASVIASVPEKEIEKYRPTKNGVSFRKKWWWIVAAAAVAAAIIVAVVLGRNGHSSDHTPSDQIENDGVENNPAVADNNIVLDSCPPAKSDTVANATDESLRPTIETVELQPANRAIDKSEVYFDINEDSVIAPVVMGYGSESKLTEAQRDQKVPMHVIFNVRNDRPYTYKLDTALTLNSAYTTGRDFVFSGQGDTIYMTDNSSNTYMLLRNKGELPLKPLTGKTFNK